MHKFFSTFHFVSIWYLRTVSLNSQLKHRLQQQKIQWSAFPEAFSLLLQMKSSLDGKVISFLSNALYCQQCNLYQASSEFYPFIASEDYFCIQYEHFFSCFGLLCTATLL